MGLILNRYYYLFSIKIKPDNHKIVLFMFFLFSLNGAALFIEIRRKILADF